MSTSAKTIVAFDYGLRHIGVAVGNRIVGTTQALSVLKAKDGIPNWQELESVLQQWQPDLVVVGDPINMDASDSELARRARKFGRRIEGRFQLPVENVDERLSSFEAKQILKEAGHKGDYKRAPADSLAAELILQSWLRANAPCGDQ